jgi:hypothetical protein
VPAIFDAANDDCLVRTMLESVTNGMSGNSRKLCHYLAEISNTRKGLVQTTSGRVVGQFA